MFYLSGCIGCYIYGALLVNFQPDVLNPLLLICSVFIGVREIFCQGGAVNNWPKKISQVAQIFTKESKTNEGHIATT